ncbi:MAG: hypothetical protein C6Y22_15940 [Hapalosiphonaceae cyanobacterium JJU2]|nr:MAG: hypothetical protein C6Y22_15940 [Hapalosiphonaceae cyanobacterium JJU2]
MIIVASRGMVQIPDFLKKSGIYKRFFRPCGKFLFEVGKFLESIPIFSMYRLYIKKGNLFSPAFLGVLVSWWLKSQFLNHQDTKARS